MSDPSSTTATLLRDLHWREIYRGPFFEVKVGDEDDSFTWVLPSGLLSRSSPFFRAALYGGWRESQERRITLPEDDRHIFQYFVTYLYCDSYSVPREVRIDHWDTAIKCWIMADKYFMDAWRKQLMAVIRMGAKNLHWLSADALDFILQNTLQGSKLRLLFRDMLAERWGRDEVREYDAELEDWEELLEDEDFAEFWEEVYCIVGHARAKWHGGLEVEVLRPVAAYLD